jgi:hypothetical protein
MKKIKKLQVCDWFETGMLSVASMIYGVISWFNSCEKNKINF